MDAHTIHQGTAPSDPAFVGRNINGHIEQGYFLSYHGEEPPPELTVSVYATSEYYNSNSTLMFYASECDPDLWDSDSVYLETYNTEDYDDGGYPAIQGIYNLTCVASVCYADPSFFIDHYGNWTINANYYYDGVYYEETEYFNVTLALNISNMTILPIDFEYFPEHVPVYTPDFNATWYIETYINDTIFDNDWIEMYFGIWDDLLDPVDVIMSYLFERVVIPINWVSSITALALNGISDALNYFSYVGSPVTYIIGKIVAAMPNKVVISFTFVLCLDIVLLVIRGRSLMNCMGIQRRRE